VPVCCRDLRGAPVPRVHGTRLEPGVVEGPFDHRLGIGHVAHEVAHRSAVLDRLRLVHSCFLALRGFGSARYESADHSRHACVVLLGEADVKVGFKRFGDVFPKELTDA
jgi:hypothetical protein